MFEFDALTQVKAYDQNAEALRFLLGGIGTGNISLDSKGALCDFEIFGRQSKGIKLPYSFFSLWYRLPNGQNGALVLEAKTDGFCDAPMGVAPGLVPGLPRFDSSRFRSAYPFASVDLYKDNFPFQVSMQAFTPFIPLNDKDSGVPGIILTYRVKNTTDQSAQVSIAATMANACGFESFSFEGLNKLYLKGHPHNRVVDEADLKGIAYSTDIDEKEIGYGSMALLTNEQEGFSAKSCWLDEGWWDGAEDFWQDFTQDGALDEVLRNQSPVSRINPTAEEKAIGSIAIRKSIGAGETREFLFYITWNFPNRYGWWPDGHEVRSATFCETVFKNYYATLWEDALTAARYLHENRNSLEKTSADFARALFTSTLDKDVIDAAASNITVLRSPTCFRIEDGTFFGWEGCFFHAGSCPGTCTHVWNYAQTLANLFPSLERSMRKTEFLWETNEEGRMTFRAKTRLEGKPWDMYPAVDGQLGSITRIYREWKMSGDDQFLKDVWPMVVKALEFSAHYWDTNGDNVLDGQQHNTYDIEFYGVNSLANSIFYAALKAGARMADYLGESAIAKNWDEMARQGAQLMDTMLFNGEYYTQKMDEDINVYKYQYGEGCLSDQLLGQTLAHLYGLGYVLNEEHVKSAIHAVYQFNYRTRMGDHESLQRGYAFQDEPGLLLCSWPKGGRPKQPFVYSDEVWTGIEYQVATNLIYEGFIKEGLNIVKGVRSRYDGVKRSPFNEVECGNHYARSMASWGLLIALSGLDVDLPADKVTIAPRVNQDNFSCFYATGKEWGVCRQIRSEVGELVQSFEPQYRIS